MLKSPLPISSSSHQMTKQIAVLFAGGTSVDFEDPEGSAIHSQAEAAPWLRKSQIFLIDTKIVPHFFFAGDALDTPSEIMAQMGRFISRYYNEYDGFVVTVGLAMMPFASAALLFMLDQIGKPVVITGSPLSYSNTTFNNELREYRREWGSIGPLTTFLGACQAAISNMGEICVASGNELLSPLRLVSGSSSGTNFFTSLDTLHLGRLDLGLRLEVVRPRRELKPNNRIAWNPNVVFLDFTLPAPKGIFDTLLEKVDGVVVRSFRGEMPQSVSRILHERAKTIPVVIMSKYKKDSEAYQKSPFLWIDNCTPETLLAKLMWALGKTGDFDVLKRIMIKNCNGEFYERVEEEGDDTV